MSGNDDKIRLSRLAYFIDLAKQGKKVSVQVVLRSQRVAQKVHPDETDDQTGDADMYLLVADFLCESDAVVENLPDEPV